MNAGHPAHNPHVDPGHGLSANYKWIVLSNTTIGMLLATINWRLVFLVSVPFGLLGTLRAYTKLVDVSERRPAKIDWIGNVTFAVGLVAVMVGMTYGIQPYGHHTMGWSSPKVLGELIAGGLLLVAFMVIETRVEQPMFNLELFRIRAFSAGNLATLLSAIGRGGLQFVLIIWLQGSGFRSMATASRRRRCGQASTCCR